MFTWREVRSFAWHR